MHLLNLQKEFSIYLDYCENGLDSFMQNLGIYHFTLSVFSIIMFYFLRLNPKDLFDPNSKINQMV